MFFLVKLILNCIYFTFADQNFDLYRLGSIQCQVRIFGDASSENRGNAKSIQTSVIYEANRFVIVKNIYPSQFTFFKLRQTCSPFNIKGTLLPG